VFRPIIWHTMWNFFRTYKVPADGRTDESVAEFMGRLAGTSVVDNLLSAMIRGIWAGDVNTLSIRAFVRSLKLQLWEMYRAGDLSPANIMREGFSRKPPEIVVAAVPRSISHFHATNRAMLERNTEFRKDFHLLSVSGAFFMDRGLGSIIDALDMALRMVETVDIRTETAVEGLWKSESGDGVVVQTTSRTNDGSGKAATSITRNHDIVISTLPPDRLVSISASSDGSMDDPLTPSLSADTSVSVGTVTFHIPKPDILPYIGFGYLIPRTVPKEKNPGSALGVLFEHNSTPTHDTSELPSTRLTVMMGGPLWPDPANITNDELIDAAKKTLKVQLGLDVDAHKDVYILAQLNKRCIPQHVVGHEARLQEAVNRMTLLFGEGKVLLNGTARYGPGVSDCIEGAWKTAYDIVRPEMTEKEKMFRRMAAEVKERKGKL
jgi:protoporphyrinogen/coproporphyrinogen III oxidase